MIPLPPQELQPEEITSPPPQELQPEEITSPPPQELQLVPHEL